METKELKVTIPKGYEIDKENSTFECIKFKKKKQSTYEDVAKELFSKGLIAYWADIDGNVHLRRMEYSTELIEPINCVSENQAKKLLAINKLMNIAKYLNGDWKPDWNNASQAKYYLSIFNDSVEINGTIYNSRIVYFKSEKFVKQAIEILGEDTIRLALSTDW